MSEGSNNLATLLDKVNAINNKHKLEAELTGSNYNVFAITKIERDEVSTHSAMIAELLNPRGSHHQGDIFLKHFIDLVYRNLDLSSKPTDSDYAKVRVVVEHNIGKRDPVEPDEYGRIDIVLWVGDHLIVIENKIDALDQPKQLERYKSWIDKQPNPTKHLLYLTKHGNNPDQISLGHLTEDKYHCLSYMQDIVTWLDLCIKDAVTAPILLGGLLQYKQLILKITGSMGDRKRMDLTNMLEHSEQQMESSLLIHQLLDNSNVQAQLQKKYWDDLKTSLADKFKQLGLALCITDDNNLENSIKKFSKGKTKNTKPIDFGVTISGEDLDTFVVRIFVAVAAVHIGIGLAGTETKIKKEDAVLRADKHIIYSMDDISTWKHTYKNNNARDGLLMHRGLGESILNLDVGVLNFNDFLNTYQRHSLYKSTVITKLSEEIISVISSIIERIR